MSTDLAQRPKWYENRTKVDLDHPRDPSDPNFLEAAKSAESPAGRYLPGKWSWGSAKSSCDW